MFTVLNTKLLVLLWHRVIHGPSIGEPAGSENCTFRETRMFWGCVFCTICVKGECGNYFISHVPSLWLDVVPLECMVSTFPVEDVSSYNEVGRVPNSSQGSAHATVEVTP